jgi:hypothetical protein
MWRNHLLQLSKLLLLNAMFASTLFANDAGSKTQAYPLRIAVLNAETHALGGGIPVPKDCDLQNFSAYCNESKNPSAENTLLVQDAEGKFYRIACTTDSRWSKCSPLPVGQMFDARREKHGMTIVFRNAKGKEIKQFYRVIAAESHPQAASPVLSSPVAAPVPPAASAQALRGEGSSEVKCNFSSTPPGADITIDDSYVGNTPSEISLITGRHVVQIAMLGFEAWKRELTVASGSVVNVTATLQQIRP